jgi:hypothetical protein
MTHEKVFDICNEVMKDSAKCNNEHCAMILRNHAMGLMRLAIDIGACNESDMDTLMEAYPM